MYRHHSPLVAPNVTTRATSPDLRMFEEWWKGFISCRGPIGVVKLAGSVPKSAYSLSN